MPISVFGMFFAFALAGALGQVHQKLRTPTWLVAILTPVLVALSIVAMRAMPFHGIFTEIPLVLLASIAASGPIAVMNRANEEIAPKRKAEQEVKSAGHAVEFRGENGRRTTKIPAMGILFMVLFFLAMPTTLFSLLSRLNYACWLQESCDGTVVLVSQDRGNHGNTMILVESGGKTDKFSPVDGAFWAQAKPGMRLTKSAGSPRAWLDGRLVRMVPLQVNWWNDSP